MKPYAIRRNPSTGRWVLYVRVAVRMWWPHEWSRSAALAPVYEIAGHAPTCESALQRAALMFSTEKPWHGF